VKVYTPAQLRQGEYETVKRLWVETWRTPFWVPSYSSPKDGIEALQDKAAALARTMDQRRLLRGQWVLFLRLAVLHLLR